MPFARAAGMAGEEMANMLAQHATACLGSVHGAKTGPGREPVVPSLWAGGSARDGFHKNVTNRLPRH